MYLNADRDSLRFMWSESDLIFLNLFRHFLYFLIASLHLSFHHGTVFLLCTVFVFPIVLFAASIIMSESWVIREFIYACVCWVLVYILMGFSKIFWFIKSWYNYQFGFLGFQCECGDVLGSWSRRVMEIGQWSLQLYSLSTCH